MGHDRIISYRSVACAKLHKILFCHDPFALCKLRESSLPISCLGFAVTSCLDFAVIGILPGLVGHRPSAMQLAPLLRAAYVFPDRAFALSFRNLTSALVNILELLLNTTGSGPSVRGRC